MYPGFGKYMYRFVVHAACNPIIVGCFAVFICMAFEEFRPRHAGREILFHQVSPLGSEAENAFLVRFAFPRFYVLLKACLIFEFHVEILSNGARKKRQVLDRTLLTHTDLSALITVQRRY